MSEDKIVLGSARVMGLEEMLSYMSEEEMVEVTPGNVRLRMRDLGGGGGGRCGRRRGG
jgi:predicted membrane GTPase involved in stress response